VSTRPVPRDEAYKAIDAERDYQDSNPHGIEHDDVALSVADWVLFMENKLDEAKAHLYQLDDEQALHSVRKVAALAVSCMEHLGVMPREEVRS